MKSILRSRVERMLARGCLAGIMLHQSGPCAPAEEPVPIPAIGQSSYLDPTGTLTPFLFPAESRPPAPPSPAASAVPRLTIAPPYVSTPPENSAAPPAAPGLHPTEPLPDSVHTPNAVLSPTEKLLPIDLPYA
jgi:hypothetical protein